MEKKKAPDFIYDLVITPITTHPKLKYIHIDLTNDNDIDKLIR